MKKNTNVIFLWERLFKTTEGPNVSDLISILDIQKVKSNRTKYRYLFKMVVSELDKKIEAELTNDDLCQIIEFSVISEFKLSAKAGYKLIKQNPENSDLVSIICYVPNYKLKMEAGTLLLKQNPNNRELLTVIDCVPRLRKDAWNILIKNNPKNKFLRDIAHSSSCIRNKALRRLLEQSPDNGDLRFIVEIGSPRLINIAEKLLPDDYKVKDRIMELLCNSLRY